MEGQAVAIETSVLDAKAEKKRVFKERMARGRSEAKKKKPVILTETDKSYGEPLLSVSAKAESNIIWFGEVDMNKKTGLPASDYPAWYHDIQIEDLKEDIRGIEKALDLELYKGKDLMRVREQLSVKKNRLNQIESSRPVINDKERDNIAKARKSLGSKISESMFTFTEMQKGTADAHVEAERMAKPCIKIDNEYEASLVKSCGMNMVGGKVSRNDACRIWKIQGKVLGEAILDTEQLRNSK